MIQVLWLGRPHCYATWEPASSLPQHLIAEFTTGVEAEPQVDNVEIYGHISSTVTVAQKSSDSQKTKRKRQERPCHDELEGYIIVQALSSVVPFHIHVTV